MLFGEGIEAEGLQLVEGGETLARSVFVAGMAEGAEDVGVLVARQAVGLGHHGVNGGADGPAGVVARQQGPREIRLRRTKVCGNCKLNPVSAKSHVL